MVLLWMTQLLPFLLDNNISQKSLAQKTSIKIHLITKSYLLIDSLFTHIYIRMCVCIYIYTHRYIQGD